MLVGLPIYLLSQHGQQFRLHVQSYFTFVSEFIFVKGEDNIKTDLQEVGRSCGDWMELAQDRDRWRELVSTVMNCRVP